MKKYKVLRKKEIVEIAAMTEKAMKELEIITKIIKQAGEKHDCK